MMICNKPIHILLRKKSKCDIKHVSCAAGFQTASGFGLASVKFKPCIYCIAPVHSVYQPSTEFLLAGNGRDVQR